MCRGRDRCCVGEAGASARKMLGLGGQRGRWRGSSWGIESGGTGIWLVERQRCEHTQRDWVLMESEPIGGRQWWNWELAGGVAEARAHAMES